jgi:heptaprenyl diphosphate synthase
MSSTRKLVQLSLLVAVGIALHIFEAALPVLNVFPTPGAKLGLANIVTLLALILWGFKEAMGVVLFRSLLASLLAGTFLSTTFYFSFAGALGSGLVMGLVYYFDRDRFSLVGISICGAVSHNLSQLLWAALLIQQAGIFIYLPYLLLFALPTGYFTGLVVTYLVSAQSPFPKIVK